MWYHPHPQDCGGGRNQPSPNDHDMLHKDDNDATNATLTRRMTPAMAAAPPAGVFIEGWYGCLPNEWKLYVAIHAVSSVLHPAGSIHTYTYCWMAFGRRGRSKFDPTRALLYDPQFDTIEEFQEPRSSIRAHVQRVFGEDDTHTHVWTKSLHSTLLHSFSA